MILTEDQNTLWKFIFYDSTKNTMEIGRQQETKSNKFFFGI